MYVACYSTWFVAAHVLESHQGPCSKPHGHNYRVRVCVYRHDLSNVGMVIDYYTLKAVVDDIVSKLDHANLNDILGCKDPTSERLAAYIFSKVKDKLASIDNNVHVRFVEVCETPDFCVMYISDQNTY
ncbi:MAG TPA: 6-carboxytetrahydropterin synthase QueD [Pyrodictium sp.]|nr:6-carboxytetrahydropterin synthase QueD [Pyrodictium sp.]